MKKSFLLLILSLLLGVYVQAQTALPTSWDCDPTTLPSTGWTTNLTDYYNAGSVGYYHSTPSAAKFNFTGCHCTIFFSEAPGTVSYYIRGASFSGGTFTVQESVNGTTWTDIHVWSTNMPTNDLSTATAIVDALNPASRYVRFYYTLKSAGNVAVDDILISKATAGPTAEIGIRVGNTDIPSGTTYAIGSASATTFKIVNYGLDSTLHITSSNITGTDASMFNITGMPANVPSEDSLTFTLNFTPTGLDGTKTATISIGNSDSDENPYVINIWAVKGSYASEPTDNASNLNITNLKSYGFTVTFSDGGSTPDGYLVLRKTGSMVPPTDLPADGSTYNKGEYINGSQVAYIGPAASFSPSFIVANTDYYFAVFPYNGYPGYENYLTASFLSGNASTPADMIGTYYSTINSSAPTFIADLHGLINPHNALYYSDYDDLVVNTVLYRDTLVGGESKKVVTCSYSGENYVYTDPWSWTYFSREHAFCQSWMPTYNDANFENLPEYADYHNLRPVNQNSVNAYRSNLPVGVVVTPSQTWHDGKYGVDTAGHTVYEPRDEVKGDVARSMLYMLVCYDGVSGNNWRLPTYLSGVYPYGQDVNVLLAWNAADPVDNWEMAHNDHIQSIQNNRNPFIDHMEWIDLIDFLTMTTYGIEDADAAAIRLSTYPNPSTGDFYLSFLSETAGDLQLKISDLSGRIVYEQNFNNVQGNNQIQIQSGLNSGTYVLQMMLNDHQYTRKVMVY